MLIAWDCFYSASFVNGTDMKIWLRQYSYHDPASNMKATGNYKKNLTRGCYGRVWLHRVSDTRRGKRHALPKNKRAKK